MTWFSRSQRERNVVCFVDDDPAEIQRFDKAMGTRFTCVTATTYEKCRERLRKERLKPDLWVLDLFFPSGGRSNSRSELEQMADKYAELERRLREFRGFLASIGQSTSGGLSLLKRCLEDYRVPVVMFTRKGTLDDAIQCLDHGATDVLKKPMPSELDGTHDDKQAQLDEAIIGHADYLEEHFRRAIRANTFWNKHRAIIMLALGALLSQGANRLFSLALAYM